MTRRVWMYLWITASLTTFLMLVPDLRARIQDPGHVEIQGIVLPPDSTERGTVEEFHRRLRQYDDLHRRLDASLPALVVSSNPASLLATVEAHKTALRSARRGARQGDILFPGIAELFRSWIRDCLKGMTPEEFVAMITEEDAPPMDLPAVNASYPDGGALTTMPPQLLHRLPGLPVGLEYRFLDRELILWDPHANLIIDFIPHALLLSGES